MKYTVLLGAILILSGCGNETSAPAKSNSKKTSRSSNTAVTAPARAVTKPLKRANTQACSGNLKHLGMSLLMFAMDNNDRFPAPNGVAGLQKLLEQQQFPTSLLCCPQVRPAVLDEKSVAFLYLGGTVQSTRNSVPLPVAIEKPGRHGNNAAVLFSDGHVENCTVSGEYTSVSQVIDRCTPEAFREKFKKAVKAIEK